jgi:AraC family transcriptional regulator
MTDLGSKYARSSEDDFRDVFAYIDANLDDDLSVARLSRVARASKFHFHHRFSAQFGLAVHRYVKLARLRRAAFQLAFRPRLRVIDIALASGYRSPEAFARAFKTVLGLTPTQFRDHPDWEAWSALNRTVGDLGARADQLREQAVHIEHVAPIRVAALELRDRPMGLGDALRTFIAWRMAHGLSPDRSATYSVFPYPASPDAIDLCAGIHRRVEPNTLGIVEKWLPGGRCARLRHVGTYRSLFDAARSLATDWLEESGERLREAPLVIRRITLFPDVPAHLAESEISLPLA